MEIIKKNIGGTSFNFYCNAGDNRSGFYHDCELWADGYRMIAHQRRQYYNRTWECYRFQSVMLDCIDSAVKEAKANIMEDYKDRNVYQKITAARRPGLEQEYENSAAIKVLELLRKDVLESRYGTEAERENLEFLDHMIDVLEALADAGLFGRKPASPAA